MYQRRGFLLRAVTAVTALALIKIRQLNSLENALFAKTSIKPGTKTNFRENSVIDGKTPVSVADVMALVLNQIHAGPIKDTVDTLKSGSPDMIVTGIISTMFPTIEIIEEARRQHANFIIAHEPSFYNHTDDTGWVAKNVVLSEKLALLEKYKIAIWRLHDNWHRNIPDGISRGFLETTGWLEFNQVVKPVFNIPSVRLKDLITHLKTTLGISHLRVIGDLDQTCQKIAISLGAAGGQHQITLAETEKPDVLIVGESNEWETPEYFRDSQKLGKKTAYIILGHSVSEEQGMRWFATWLQPKLPELKITHIASGDPFKWL